MNDFKTLYTATSAFRLQRVPYDDGVLKQTWQEGLQSAPGAKTAPGLPETPMVYPPGLLLIFLPLSFIPYPEARMIYFLLQLGALAGIARIVSQLGNFAKKRQSMLLFVLILLSLKGIRLALLSGQFALLSFYFSLQALKQNAEDRAPAASGLWLAVALFKPQLGLPFLIDFLLRRRYRVCLIAVIGFAVICAIALLIAPSGTLPSMVAAVRQSFAPGQINDYTFENSRYFGLTGVHTLLFGLTGSRSLVSGLSLALLCIALYGLWRRREALFETSRCGLFLLVVLSLVLTYHRIYDTAALVTCFLVGDPPRLLRRHRPAFLLGMPLFIPLTGLMLRISAASVSPFLLLDVPLSLLGLGGYVMVCLVRCDRAV